MEWFRFYHEALDDLKVQELPAPTFKLWVNLLCLANMGTPRGRLPDVRRIAFRLRLSEQKAAAFLAEMFERELLDRDEDGNVTPHNWPVRQRKSDDIAGRVKKHRSNVTAEDECNDDVTLHVTRLKRSRATDTETDTETDTDAPQPPRASSYTAEFDEFWQAYPRKKNKDEAWRAWKARKDRPPVADLVASIARHRASVEWVKDGGAYIPYPATWIRAGGWKDEDAPPNGIVRLDPNSREALEQRSRDAMARLV